MSVINGTSGADALNGTALGDQINGGAGDDVLRGFGGADTLDGGAGADRFLWNAGDGSDQVEGGADGDTEFFAADGFVISAGAGHALVTNRAETVDLHGVETLNLHGQSGATAFTVGDLSATDVRQVVIGLGGQSTADTVALTGGATGDLIEAQVLSGTTLRVFDSVNGVVQTNVISNVGSADQVTIDGGAGNDAITITTPSGLTSPALISARGGEGADTITGSIGAERLFGDAGDDQINGGGGADTIDGGAGVDSLTVTGGETADTVVLSASGGHLRTALNGATADVANVETLIVRTLGQGDTITLGDLASTQVRTVTLDLSAPNGGQDGQADTVILTPEAGTEVSFTSSADGTGVQAAYTAAGALTQTVNITGLGATDTVRLAGGNGDDLLSTIGFASQARVAVDGGAGANREAFTGTGGSDSITLLPNGTHAELTLNGSAPLDLVNVQTVVIQALEGADTVVVGDLAATDVTDVVVNLGDSAGRPDGQPDLVTFNYALTQSTQLLGDFSASANSLHLGIPGVRNTDVTNFEAQDRVVVNLSGAGPYNLRGDFGHTEFQLGATQDNVEWTLSERQVDHDTINGGAGNDALEIGFDGAQRRLDGGSGWSVGVLNNAGHTELALHHAANESFGLVEATVEVFSFERVNVYGGAGSDIVVVTDQTGTGLQILNIDIGGAGPDEYSDYVIIDGSSGADLVSVTASSEAGELKITGLPESVNVHNLRSGERSVLDHVFIRAGAGDDVLDFTNHGTGRGLVNLGGGSGDDTLIGGSGAEAFELQTGLSASHDVVRNFHAHATGGEVDVVWVIGSPDHSFEDLIARGHLLQSGADVLVLDGLGSSLTLINVSLSSLSADDFFF